MPLLVPIRETPCEKCGALSWQVPGVRVRCFGCLPFDPPSAAATPQEPDDA